jgi:hypothetical protein
MLDKIYINEAKRIRKEYLNNLVYIVTQESVIKGYVNSLNDIKKEISETQNESDDYFRGKLMEIDKKIIDLNKYLLVYYDKIKKLDIDQRRLYNTIKEKYPLISDDNMKNEIINHLDDINKDFIRRNENLYVEIENYNLNNK